MENFAGCPRGRGAEPEPDAKPAGFSAPRMMGVAQMGGRELRARIPGSARVGYKKEVPLFPRRESVERVGVEDKQFE